MSVLRLGYVHARVTDMADAVSHYPPCQPGVRPLGSKVVYRSGGLYP